MNEMRSIRRLKRDPVEDLKSHRPLHICQDLCRAVDLQREDEIVNVLLSEKAVIWSTTTIVYDAAPWLYKSVGVKDSLIDMIICTR